MTFRVLAIFLTLFSTAAMAQGRSPAVEDFVGIEVEESQVAPQGTESLYNLEQDLKVIEAQKDRKPVAEPKLAEASSDWNAMTVFGISLGMGLPMIVWLLMMAHLKKKASVESASNIEVLENYRKEREKKATEEKRKAS